MEKKIEYINIKFNANINILQKYDILLVFLIINHNLKKTNLYIIYE